MSIETPEAPSRNGAGLPIGTVSDILTQAPLDSVEEIIQVPEWKCSLRLRSLSARQVAHVKEIGMKLAKDGASIVHTEMEIAQFHAGVIEPRFEEHQVRQLFNIAGGGGWARVIEWLDAHSGMSEEERRKAADTFPG